MPNAPHPLAFTGRPEWPDVGGPPPLAPDFRVRRYVRVVGWAYYDDRPGWHDLRSLHAHLACGVIGRWQRGGFARDHAASGRTGIPMPPAVVAEYHVPTDVPWANRCALCWGRALTNTIPDSVWRAREAWVPYADDARWHCTPAQVRWWGLQVDAARVLWRQHAGGIYEPEHVPLAPL